MLIHENMKLADVVHHDYTLVPIINRFGIHLGFGDDNIAEICQKHDVNTDFFITILNAFHDTHYFPREQLQHFSTALLIDYLRKAHRDFLEDKVPEIFQLIDNLAEKHPLDHKTSGLIRDFFAGYTRELSRHIQREEEKVYPYVLHLEMAVSAGKADDKTRKELKIMPISTYEAEHENVEEKLFDLKNILIKYLPEPTDDKPAYLLLRELFILEKELNEHARIEDLILIPKVKALENMLKENKPRRDV
jgi:regulator of cell morphogenesis and NO signaling